MQTLRTYIAKSLFRFIGVSVQHADGIYEFDTFGDTLFANRAMCEIFGYSAKEMEKLYQPPHKVFIQQRAMTKEGWRWFEWVNTGILDENTYN